MRGALVFFLILFAFADRVAIAQEIEVETLQPSASGLEYLKAVRFRGIDTEVRYFDPTGPAPALETELEPEEERRNGGMTLNLDGQWVVAIIALLVILLMGFLAYLGWGGTSVSFRKEAKDARPKSVNKPEEEEQPQPDLETILRHPDRQKALVKLAQFVLTRCLNVNGVLFKRSWTQREALRRLPNSLPHLSDLRALVLDSERVRFGHRKVSNSEFQAHILRIRPMLQGMAQ